MKSATSSCSDDQLRLLLYGEEDAAEFKSAQQHLESCPTCQSRFDELAADRDEWEEASHLLAVNEADKLTASEEAERAWSVSGHRRPPTTWTDAMTSQLLSPPSHPEMLGRIGRYEVERLIGAGGMGVVFKAFDSELNRPVVIKVLAPHLAGSGAARQRFSREARAAAAIVHEHVVAIHNVESESEPPFLVMPYIAGGSLQSRLDRTGPLSVCEVLRIARQIAAGLAAAHGQGVVHRDVKPSNVLLEEGVDRALLADFGLARAADDASLTHTGCHPGTPQYMSPEQARGERIDATSDLFSLGSVMYTMCSGRPPFRAETSYGILRRITDNEPRPIREINPEVPEWLCAIIAKLLAKRPADRFASASAVEVAELLEHCLAHVQQPTTVPLPDGCLSLHESKAPDQPQGASLRFPRKPPTSLVRLIMGAAFAFTLLFAGILIVLELNKGTLTIECEADEVPIRISQGDEVVERLTVTRSGASIRVAAGTYSVIIDGQFDGIVVVDGAVSLQRSGKQTVRIVRADVSNDSSSDPPKRDEYDGRDFRLQTELSSRVPTTEAEIIDIYRRVFDRLPTDLELSRAFETIVARLKSDEALREKTLQARKVQDWIGEAAKNPFDQFAKDQIAEPLSPKNNWVVECALHFGGELSAEGIERAYERALDRKPTNAETIATFEWLIDQLLADKQFPKYAGKGLFGGGDMLDKKWDGSFRNVIDSLRKEFELDNAKTTWPDEAKAPGTVDSPTIPGTVHAASRSREKRWEIRYPSEPGRFANALDFLGVELGVARGGSQEVTYLSGVSAASPAVRRGPGVSETRLYLTMADADSIRIAKSLLEQAGIETRDRILLWFYSPWAERTLASLEAKAADAQSIDLVDRTVFGVHAQGEEFEFYVISQESKGSTTGSHVELPDDSQLSSRGGAVVSVPNHEKLAEIRSQAHAALMSIETLQYRFEQKDDEGGHAKAEFYGDRERFRVNRDDVTGLMGLDAELKPKRSDPLKSASAFDGQRQQYMHVINGSESLRVKAGRAGASYGIYTPQLWPYLWLRQGSKEFLWDTILSVELWEWRFKDAVYIGDVTEDGRRFEIVDFPQRVGSVTPCIYRVYFARDLGFLPLKYFRTTMAKNELSTTMEVTRFKTFSIDDKQIAIPLEVRHQETHADGVSKKGERTITVDEDSLKVNEPLDESLFTLSRVDDAAESELSGTVSSVRDKLEKQPDHPFEQFVVPKTSRIYSLDEVYKENPADAVTVEFHVLTEGVHYTDRYAKINNSQSRPVILDTTNPTGGEPGPYFVVALVNEALDAVKDREAGFFKNKVVRATGFVRRENERWEYGRRVRYEIVVHDPKHFEIVSGETEQSPLSTNEPVAR